MGLGGYDWNAAPVIGAYPMNELALNHQPNEEKWGDVPSVPDYFETTCA
jgi:hypothetical protein